MAPNRNNREDKCVDRATCSIDVSADVSVCSVKVISVILTQICSGLKKSIRKWVVYTHFLFVMCQQLDTADYVCIRQSQLWQGTTVGELR